MTWLRPIVKVAAARVIVPVPVSRRAGQRCYLEGIGRIVVQLGPGGCSNSEAPCCRAAVRCQEGGGVQSCWTMTRSLMTLLAWSRM